MWRAARGAEQCAARCVPSPIRVMCYQWLPGSDGCHARAGNTHTSPGAQYDLRRNGGSPALRLVEADPPRVPRSGMDAGSIHHAAIKADPTAPALLVQEPRCLPFLNGPPHGRGRRPASPTKWCRRCRSASGSSPCQNGSAPSCPTPRRRRTTQPARRRLLDHGSVTFHEATISPQMTSSASSAPRSAACSTSGTCPPGKPAAASALRTHCHRITRVDRHPPGPAAGAMSRSRTCCHADPPAPPGNAVAVGE
jgi:hypothetical protein